MRGGGDPVELTVRGVRGECAGLSVANDLIDLAGTDAGAAHSFEPAFPCHRFLLGAGKFGLTQLQNVAKLPPTER